MKLDFDLCKFFPGSWAPNSSMHNENPSFSLQLYSLQIQISSDIKSKNGAGYESNLGRRPPTVVLVYLLNGTLYMSLI